MYLAIQVACFDVIFDCITNMIGRLFNLHIVKSTPNNQIWKRRGFLIFILTLTSHFTFHMFSSCSVKCSVKMTFWYFITCYIYSIRNFKIDFAKPSFKHAKVIFFSVAFLYSFSIYIQESELFYFVLFGVASQNYNNMMHTSLWMLLYLYA